MTIQLVAERQARSDEEAALLRLELVAKCDEAMDQIGDDIAGFAVVAWGKDGTMYTAYKAARGLITPALVPTLVADALNRHVAVMFAKDELASDAGPQAS